MGSTIGPKIPTRKTDVWGTHPNSIMSCHSEERSDEESAFSLTSMNSRALAALGMTQRGLCRTEKIDSLLLERGGAPCRVRIAALWGGIVRRLRPILLYHFAGGLYGTAQARLRRGPN